MTESTHPSQKRSRLLWILLLLLLVLAILFSLWYWQSQRLEQARQAQHPPQVVIHHPSQGQVFLAGAMSYINAEASGRKAIESVELWMNGHLVEVQSSPQEGGSKILYATFDTIFTEGVNWLLVKAVDVEGIVGQSLPISVTAEPRLESQEAFTSAFFEPGMNLEQFAEERGLEVAEIRALNPDFFSQEQHPEGGVLRIPVQPEETTEPGDSPIVEPPIAGFVEGKICYPSEQIPAMTAYFEETSTHQFASLPISQNQTFYKINLSPGTYIAYAWLPDFSQGGSFSKAVPCGLTNGCNDHTPLPFTVQAGLSLTDIDICDWYSPSLPPTPPPPPGGGGASQASGPPSAIGPMLKVSKTKPEGNVHHLPWTMMIPAGLPTVPTNLVGDLDGCKIRISWTHPGQNTSGYLVWLSGQNGALYLLADLKPGSSEASQHWYEFTSSLSGTVSIWVESYNALGVQPGNPTILTLGSQCADTPMDKLEFRAMEIQVGGGFDRAYAYISLEGNPEERIPADDSDFIYLQEGQADIGSWAKETQNYVLLRPEDGDLLVEGQCWGWQGEELLKISSFSTAIPQSRWNGDWGSIGDPQCQIRYQLGPLQSAGTTLNTYEGNAPDVPAPFNVRSTRWGDDSGDALEQYMWFWERVIQWQWKGDIKKISGFTIFLNGKPIKTVSASDRGTTVTLPGWCGPDNKWLVKANGVDGSQAVSAPAIEPMPLCTKWAKVTFFQLYLDTTCDGYCKSLAPCDTLQIYFRLTVNNITDQFFGDNFFAGLDCGAYFFKDLTGGHHEYIVPIYDHPSDPYDDPVEIYVGHKFWDYDTFSKDDLVSSFWYHVWYPSFDVGLDTILDWYSYDEYGLVLDDGKHYTGTAKSNSVVILRFYPNPLKSAP